MKKLKSVHIVDIDYKLFNKQRFALCEILLCFEQGKTPTEKQLKKWIPLLDALQNLADHMADLMTGREAY